MKPKNPVEQLYDAQSEREWDRLARHRTEFAVTMRALVDYLPPAPAPIADIGGGPGRYAIALTQKGYAVTLIDLSQKNLELARAKASAMNVSLSAVLHGDALDLSALTDSSFTAVLLLGPLYHLLEEGERETAVREAHRILQPDGLIFAAFITRFAPFRDMAARGYTDWIVNHAERAALILDSGRNPAMSGNSFPNSYFAHPREIRPLLERCGFDTLNLLGCEGVVAGHEAHVNALEGELWQKWVDLNYQLGQDPALHGAADHLLYIGRKMSA